MHFESAHEERGEVAHTLALLLILLLLLLPAVVNLAAGRPPPGAWVSANGGEKGGALGLAASKRATAGPRRQQPHKQATPGALNPALDTVGAGGPRRGEAGARLDAGESYDTSSEWGALSARARGRCLPPGAPEKEAGLPFFQGGEAGPWSAIPCSSKGGGGGSSELFPRPLPSPLSFCVPPPACANRRFPPLVYSLVRLPACTDSPAHAAAPRRVCVYGRPAGATTEETQR